MPGSGIRREIVGDRARRLDRGDRVLEDQLILTANFDDDRELVEILDQGVELPAVHQVNGDRHTIAAREGVEV